MLGVLNISGVPPFFMFYAKIIILLEILSIGGITMAVILAQRSVIFIYIYMKLFLDKLTMGLLGARIKVGHVFSK
jgi:NADH:ubiquinone oxidoreductase subunit 2 (subunit N)